jgi:glycosyltransferase involved in cell wall biosynthesis
MESLLCQTFEDFEVLVVDDGSIEESPEILAIPLF